MNEEIQKKVLSYLEAIEQQASDAGGFVIEQAPLFAQELVSWWFWGSVIYCGISGVIFAVSSIATCVVWVWLTDDSTDEFSVLSAIFLPAIASLSFIVLCANALDATKAAVAPRLVLMEEIIRIVERIQ